MIGLSQAKKCQLKLAVLLITEQTLYLAGENGGLDDFHPVEYPAILYAIGVLLSRNPKIPGRQQLASQRICPADR
jgi:hypothetical protein